MRTWTFKDYQEYQAYQKSRAKRTRGITRRHAGLRVRVMELLKTHCPQASSLLCLGARSRVEVEHFQSAGFQAEGIDLYADGPVYACDMSDLDGNERYRNRDPLTARRVLSLESAVPSPGPSFGSRFATAESYPARPARSKV